LLAANGFDWIELGKASGGLKAAATLDSTAEDPPSRNEGGAPAEKTPV
jgi:hypothetical protein